MPSRRDLVKMSEEEVAAFLDEERVLNVATNGPSGHPHVVAMWFAMRDGSPVFWTFGKSQKVTNLRRDPKISALVEAGDVYQELRGVELVGTGRVIEDHDEIMAIARQVSTKYAGGTPPDAATEGFLEAQARKRVGVVIDVERVVSWDHRKLEGGY
jgi:PPOX class probable F420-dependent enzyme